MRPTYFVKVTIVDEDGEHYEGEGNVVAQFDTLEEAEYGASLLLNMPMEGI